jgi:hypothetical protein
MIGLAMRRDLRVLPPLISSLEGASVPDRAIEAAIEMMGLQIEEGEKWTGVDYAVGLRKMFGV